jgi:hypothetical protein
MKLHSFFKELEASTGVKIFLALYGLIYLLERTVHFDGFNSVSCEDGGGVIKGSMVMEQSNHFTRGQ